jgi:hypothetical protein
MAQTETQIANRFKVGNPGGPGRPKKRPQTEANESVLNAQVPEPIWRALKAFGLKKDATWAEAIALSLAHQAVVKGNVLASKELRESVEGRSVQRHELLSHEDKKVTISVEYESAVASREEQERLAQLPEKIAPADMVIDVSPGERAVMDSVTDEENRD